MKYLLPRLTECCSKYLFSILNTNNVCGILELSFTFNVEDLKRQCVEFVANNSETVLNGDELLALSRESFEAILKSDRIMSGPSTLFNSCVKWAKHRLQKEQSVDAPSDLQIRKTLGNLLYEIPFPTISATEFANLVGESEILTTKETSAVYYYLASRKGKEKLKFNVENRHERVVNLATKIIKGLWPHSKCSSCNSFKKSSFEVSFKANKDILLTGIGLYKGHDGYDYEVDIQVIQEKNNPLVGRTCKRGLQRFATSPESQAQGTNLFKGAKRIVPHTESSTAFKVSFDEPVLITEGTMYKVSVLAYKAIGYCGELCNEILVDDVTFTVTSASLDPSGIVYGCSRCGVTLNSSSCSKCSAVSGLSYGNNSAVSTYGQMPQLYFIPL